MDDYKNLATDLALKAGKIMKANFSLGMKKEWKKDSTPLTITDTTINRMVIEEIQENFPDHSIVGEEESFDNKSEYVWVCDPVDGTIPFSHGYPTFVFSLALVKEGKPILGVVYDPMLDRLIVGEKGKGSTVNGKKIQVSKEKKINSKSIINADCGTKLVKLREKLIEEKGCFVTNFLSSVYSGTLVAYGEFLAEIYEYSFPWDGAALKIIIEEAGGKVTDLDGNDQRYDQTINGFVASNGLIHSELLGLIKEIKN